MNCGNDSHITGMQSSKCSLYWSQPLPISGHIFCRGRITLLCQSV